MMSSNPLNGAPPSKLLPRTVAEPVQCSNLDVTHNSVQKDDPHLPANNVDGSQVVSSVSYCQSSEVPMVSQSADRPLANSQTSQNYVAAPAYVPAKAGIQAIVSTAQSCVAQPAHGYVPARSNLSVADADCICSSAHTDSEVSAHRVEAASVGHQHATSHQLANTQQCAEISAKNKLQNDDHPTLQPTSDVTSLAEGLLPITGNTVRKSSFMITSVINKDVDDVVASEDANSLLCDSPCVTAAEMPSSADTVHSPLSPHFDIASQSADDTHSRFRIVKIESRDRFHRGRWTCHDFTDPPEHTADTQMAAGDKNPKNNLLSQHQIYIIPGVQDMCKSPFGIVYSDGGHPVLEPNLLPSPLYARGAQFFTTSNLVASPNIEIPSRQLFSDVVKTSVAPMSESRKNITCPEILPSSEDIVVDGNIGNIVQRSNSQASPLDAMMSATLSADGDLSGTGAVAIDNKIEQAMDLVKSHLMFAVREEVDLLKEQIKELLARNAQLEYENSILRASASPETLAQLSAAVSQ